MQYEIQTKVTIIYSFKGKIVNKYAIKTIENNGG